jgi:hypothetical protein
MKKYLVKVKPPFVTAILTKAKGLMPSKESDQHRHRREVLGNRLENFLGAKPEWRQQNYSYRVAMTAEQAAEVKTWDMVRAVVEQK